MRMMGVMGLMGVMGEMGLMGADKTEIVSAVMQAIPGGVIIHAVCRIVLF